MVVGDQVPGGRRRWSAEERRRRFAVPLAAACLVAGLVSLGPDDGLASLPYRFLRDVVPGLASARALNRFWALPALGLALLAGQGLERLAGGRSAVVRLGVGTALAALLVAELLVRPGFSPVADDPELLAVNDAVAALPDGVVTELPVPTLPAYPYVLAARQLRSLEDGEPRVEGYSGSTPAGLAEYLAAVSSFPSERAVAALRQAGVRHVVLHGAQEPCVARYGPAELAAIVEAAAASPAVERVTRVGDDAVVTLTPAARRGSLTDIPAVAPVARTTAPCPVN